jgi:hypothetical protein
MQSNDARQTSNVQLTLTINFFCVRFFCLSLMICAEQLVWLFAPQTNGAQLIYTRAIEPVLIKYESHIDRASVQGRAAAERITGDVANEVSNTLSGSAAQQSKKAINDAASSLLNQSNSIRSEASTSEPKKAI